MSDASHASPLLTLWFKPSQTVRSMLETGHGHGIALLIAALFGFVQAIPFLLGQDSGGVGFFVGGAVFGLIGLYLFAWLLRNFGRWFGAQAKVREVRGALGLSLLPWLVLFGALFGLRQSLGSEAIQSYYLLFFLGFVYGYAVILLCLSAALRLSVLKTFLCLVVTFLVSVFPITLFLQLAPVQ